MKLDPYLRRFGVTSRDFAKRTGASVHAVRKYRQGTRIPRRDMMLKIKEATKGQVSPSDWY